MKQSERLPFPIDPFIPQIVETVMKHSTVMVKASPGSGKTTRLPWALASGTGHRVLVLEPRRLAARLAAERIAFEESLEIGKEIGYHFRFEKKLKEETKVRFYTEGTFLKILESSDGIRSNDIIILDEFHERHLDTDLALAFLLNLQKTLNLKLVLMSATLDLKLMEFLDSPGLVEIEIPRFPVKIHYLPNQPSILSQSLETKIKNALSESQGDTLVFLPGMREILRVQEAIKDHYQTFILHGELDREDQDKALAPSSSRKVILSTNIAESSVTIPGISVVIDSGIQRSLHYSPWTGLKLLKDDPVTKSSAIQRAGRAGRTGPGECFRLYAELDFNERDEHTLPEIKKADLVDLVLSVKSSALSPKWFESPIPQKWEQAEDLLHKLGILIDGKITSLAEKMQIYPVDARLSRVLVEGESLVRPEKEKLLNYICRDIEQDRSGILRRRLDFFLKESSATSKVSWEFCLLTGFVDQVARWRSDQRDFIHYSGKTLKTHHSLNSLTDGYYLVLDVTQKMEAIQVVPIEEEWLWDLSPFPFAEEDEIKVGEKIVFRKKTMLGSIVIEETNATPTWSSLNKNTREKLITLARVPFEKYLASFQEMPEFEKLNFYVSQNGKSLDQEMRKITVENYFESNDFLNWEQLSTFVLDKLRSDLNIPDLERLLPDSIDLGGKRRLKVYYPHNMDPYLEAPIQDFYGIDETPRIMNGKISLQLKLLGPHKRPIQVTKDLKNFWRKTYQELLKEYQREYPRHHWPANPWEAKPILLKSQLPKV